MMTGYEREYEATLRREAAWVAHLMNATGNMGSDPMTVDKLLGKSGAEQSQDDAKMAELLARAEQRKAERLKARAARGEHHR